MKTTDGVYNLALSMDLTKEEIAAILNVTMEFIDSEVGSHLIQGHLRTIMKEVMYNEVRKCVSKTSDSELSEIMQTIGPLFKERKFK